MTKKQVKEENLLEILKRNDEIKKFYEKLYHRERLTKQLYEIYHKKYGKRKLKSDSGEENSV